MYTIVGRLDDQPTPLSAVQVFAFKLNRLKWITEKDLLEIIAKLGIREVYGMELVEKRMIPIYMN